MGDRKDYVAPAIAAEDVLEQTSLACQVTEPFNPDGAGGAFAPGVGECSTNVNKGGAFAGGGCTFKPPNLQQVVVLS
jgi:hypothetical protein